jgi:pimeloyl-ACP methyl ester carboxylesterase
VVIVGVGFPLVFATILFFLQRRIIYFPSKYELGEKRMLIGKMAQPVPYRTAAGDQTAFYVAAHPGKRPARLWVLFAGNASRALDWLDFLDPLLSSPTGPETGFLLIDYPGYGLCEGRPTRAAIDQSSEAAFAALARRWGGDAQALEGDLNILAHSLGTAAGLQFAAHHPVRRVVLAAPFTSLEAMARQTVGRPLCWLLLDRFDNRARLGELARRTPRPAVTIFHGDADEIIPVAQGRELARDYAGWVVYHEIKNGDHNGVIDLAQHQIIQAMTE